MKTCKACQLEIHDKATKCPHCLSFQSAWNTWMVLLPILLIFPLMLFMMNMMTLFGGADFKEHKNQVTYQLISKELITNKSGTNRLKLVGEIDNRSDIDWRHPDFKITVNNEKGEFHNVIYETSYNIKAPAKIKTKTSTFVLGGELPEGYTMDVELINMKPDR